MTNPDPMYRRIRLYIDEIAKMSRKLVAINAGISESMLSKMLSGQRRISIDDYEKLCMAMSVNPAKFYMTAKGGTP